MKPKQIDETFGSIEHHIRRAQVQRVVFLAEMVSRAIVVATQALGGTARRLKSATAARSRRGQLAPR